jgi:hypothetical protein
LQSKVFGEPPSPARQHQSTSAIFNSRIKASIQFELLQMLLTLGFSHLIRLFGLQQHMSAQNKHINLRR